MNPRVLSRLALLVALALAGCGAGPRVHPPGWGATPKGLFALPAPVTGVPSAEMFDTVTVSTVPARPFALAGYTSGFWPTYLPLRRAYPTAHTVSIAVTARNHADCLDVEPGDASPSQAGPWVRADIAAGFPKPCLYSDLEEMPAVKASLAAWLGSGWRGRVLLWLAWYRYRPGLVAGYDAVQWTDHAYGRNLDESTVTLSFLTIAQPAHVPPRPKPKPRPTPHPHAARIALLRRLAKAHGCYVRHRPKKHACEVWRREVERLERA